MTKVLATAILVGIILGPQGILAGQPPEAITDPAAAAPEPPVRTQSNPSWWMYASPEATALVGMQWNYLRSSPLAQAVSAELSPDGSLAFPNWEFLASSEQVLIASPALMALAYGNFPAAQVRASASAKGLKSSMYRGVELWVTPEKDTMSVARINDQLVLFGHIPTIKDAIDRSMATGSKRSYSPLLAQGARYSKEDLWVVTSHWPDPLASLFVPLDIEARSFEGSVSFWDGVHIAAAFQTNSASSAEAAADQLWDHLEAVPALADAAQVSTDGRMVLLSIDLDDTELQSALHKPAQTVATAEPSPTPLPPTKPSANKTKSATVAANLTPEAKSSKASPAASVSPKPSTPRLKAPEPKTEVSTEILAAAPRPDDTVSAPASRKSQPVAVMAAAAPSFATPAPVVAPAPPAAAPEPPKRRVVRIIGLDDGPREINLDPVPSDPVRPAPVPTPPAPVVSAQK